MSRAGRGEACCCFSTHEVFFCPGEARRCRAAVRFLLLLIPRDEERIAESGRRKRSGSKAKRKWKRSGYRRPPLGHSARTGDSFLQPENRPRWAVHFRSLRKCTARVQWARPSQCSMSDVCRPRRRGHVIPWQCHSESHGPAPAGRQRRSIKDAHGGARLALGCRPKGPGGAGVCTSGSAMTAD